MGALEAYLRSLKKRPLQTKATTSACIQACSDTLAQKLSGAKKLDLRRTMLMSLFGYAWVGPSMHYWQKWLEVLFKGQKSRSPRTVVSKSIVDQLVYGPCANAVAMTFITLMIEKKTFSQLRHKLRKSFWSTQLSAWRIWPLASLLNNAFVPLQLRALFMNAVGFLWSTLLILKSQAKKIEK